MTRLSSSEVRSFLLDYFKMTIVANGLDPGSLAPDFDLLMAGVIDSLGVLEMISAVENRFQISVDFETMDPAGLTVLDRFSAFVAANAIGR